jgi:hypothetical protein
MAAKPQISPEITRLVQAGELARARLGREVAAVRQALSVPAAAVQSLRTHPIRWLGGVLGTGFAATLVFRRKPRPARKPRGLPVLLLGWLAAAARPIIKTWLTAQLKQVLATRFTAKSQSPSHSANSGFPIHR